MDGTDAQPAEGRFTCPRYRVDHGRTAQQPQPLQGVRVKVALPPLPPAFGVTDDDVLPGGRSMLDLLTEEHHLLAQLCTRLPATAEVLVAALSRHLSAEEQYLYPAARKVLPDGVSVADREVAADASLLRTLAEFHGTRPSDDAIGPHDQEV